MTFPSDTAVVDLMAALYSAPSPTSSAAPNTAYGFDRIAQVGGVYFGIAGSMVICRGSADPEDWIRDGLSEVGHALPDFRQLELLPYGFSEGIREAYKAMALPLDVPVTFGGHSLGAAHAAEIAGIHLVSGGKVLRPVLCGCPKPGMKTLARFLSGRYVLMLSLRNEGDPVPDVPVALAPLLPWSPAASDIYINEPPPAGVTGPFAHHNIACYQAGVRKLTA